MYTFIRLFITDVCPQMRWFYRTIVRRLPSKQNALCLSDHRDPESAAVNMSPDSQRNGIPGQSEVCPQRLGGKELHVWITALPIIKRGFGGGGLGGGIL